jgi:hypothetical protein
MPTFPKLPPDLPDHLEGFHIGATVSEPAGGGQPVASLVFSVAVVTAAGRVHQFTGDLTEFLSPAQVTAFTNAALALYAQAKTELLA